MIKYNANPKGWKTDDCVIRAIALASEQTWDKVFLDLNELAFKKKRVFNDPCVYNEYLKQIGWLKQSQPRFYDYEDGHKSGMKKQTIYEFIMNLNHERHIGGRVSDAYLITVAHHMTCVKYDNDKNRYELYDTWDCGEKTIGNYWINQ